MGIRTKLLVILLILAVVPLLIAAVVSRGTMHSLGDRLTTEAEQRVVEEERRQLGVIATSMAETVRARATEIERILRLQTISAVRALESEPAQDIWYDARLDFDAARRAVPGMVEREIVGLDGTTHRTQQVSMEHQAMLLREGEGREERERTASRLASMDACTDRSRRIGQSFCTGSMCPRWTVCTRNFRGTEGIRTTLTRASGAGSSWSKRRWRKCRVVWARCGARRSLTLRRGN
ncbi:MAG: hypothetical protein ACNA8P_07460 [Phycisphaerales bacterium]